VTSRIRYVITRSCVKGIVVREGGKLFPVDSESDGSVRLDKWLTEYAAVRIMTDWKYRL